MFDLKEHGLTYQSDFAFVIDTTGSMGDDIGAVRDSIRSIIDAVFGGGSTDGRMGIVGFKDETIGEPTSVLLPFTDQVNFLDRQNAITAAINSIGVSGGGDLPETPFAGLLKALDGSMGEWRPGAGSLRVVLFTDAEAKDGDLAAVVAKYAANIGATVTTGRSEGSLFGTKDSFALSYGVGGAQDRDHDGSFSSVSDPLTRPGPGSLEVYTINTGGSHLDFSELQDLSKETGGGYFRPENTAEFVEYIKNVIEAPAEEYHVYRFFNAHNGSHFYTSNPEERDFIIANLPGYSYEGEAFTSSEDATTGEAVHRFFNTQLGYHFYTINSDEAESVKKSLPGFAYEGIAYYAEDEESGGKQALYRFYNEDVGNHFYTASEEERHAIEVNLPQYRYEGVAYYVDVA